MIKFLIKLTLRALCKLTRAYYKKYDDVAQNHDDSETIHYYGSAVVGSIYKDHRDKTKRVPVARLTIRSSIKTFADISAYE